jgi:hypothetical protein
MIVPVPLEVMPIFSIRRKNSEMEIDDDALFIN